jgi:AcrR family transcriptional regulator
MNDHSVRKVIGPDLDVKRRPPCPTLPYDRSDVSTLLSPAAEKTGTDKRDAILAGALRLIARLGLHNAPMSGVAREAGVAAGTLYLYFPSKEAMINALYLELLDDRERAVAVDPHVSEPREGLRQYWHGLARWHLDHPDASSFLQQCQSSAILTSETREEELRRNVEGFAKFDAAVAAGFIRDLPRPVFYALLAGPIFVLAQLRDSGEIVLSDEVLEMTFDAVCRSVLPPQ